MKWPGFITSTGGAHSFWPCSVNILEHSGCSGGSPESLYLNIIKNISYTDIHIIQYRYYHGQKLCAPPDDTINLERLIGSPTSLVLALSHQSEVQTELRHGRERDCGPGAPLLGHCHWSLVGRAPPTARALLPQLQWQCPGRGAPGAQSLSRPCHSSIISSGYVGIKN